MYELVYDVYLKHKRGLSNHSSIHHHQTSVVLYRDDYFVVYFHQKFGIAVQNLIKINLKESELLKGSFYIFKVELKQ